MFTGFSKNTHIRKLHSRKMYCFLERKQNASNKNYTRSSHGIISSHLILFWISLMDFLLSTCTISGFSFFFLEGCENSLSRLDHQKSENVLNILSELNPFVDFIILFDRGFRFLEVAKVFKLAGSSKSANINIFLKKCIWKPLPAALNLIFKR